MKFLPMLLLLVSCATPTKNFRDRNNKAIEDCVIRLVNEGLSEEITYPICKDIYEKKKLLIIQPQVRTDV